MTRPRLLVALGLTAAALAAFRFGFAQTPSAAPSAEATAKANFEAFTKAANAKDLDALGKLWADNAEHIGDDGEITTGKAAITEMFKKLFADHPKLSVSLTHVSSKFLGPDAMLVDGITDVKTGDGTDTSRFESLWVRSAAGWQISRVRELEPVIAAGDSNYEQLKQLEWMVGDWTSETGAYSVALSIKWGKNKNYFVVDQSISANGRESVSVHKIVGWDPLAGAMCGYVFDSDGGVGSSYFVRNANVWVEACDAVTRTGGQGSSTQTIKFVTDSSFEWTATERELDGRPLPDIRIHYTRKPAAK